MDQDRQQEQDHFDSTIALLEDNITAYRQREQHLKAETDDLYAAVARGGETALYNQLAAAMSILEHTKNAIRKQEAALHKPYFGRIDFDDLEEHTCSSLYIGKNGISKEQEVIIVDWRAPVSSVYYENEMGEGCYEVPTREALLNIPIDLKRKRTYDTEEGKLMGYYDNDVASNDELLVKYLAKNKDAVLGDIIATIQKEQNEIIRDKPYKNMIVQGVAGSGKTTVAMHRISYLLYNYEGRIHPSEFCIIGSNDMLLSYITSGLPELDVSHVRHMRMDEIFIYLLEKQWKKTCKVVTNGSEETYKSRLAFIAALDAFLMNYRKEVLPAARVRDASLGTVLSEEHIRETIRMNDAMSIEELASLINDKIQSRIGFLMDLDDKDKVREKKKQYRRYVDPLKGRNTGIRLYEKFLDVYEAECSESTGTYVTLCETRENLKKNRFDVYDLAALVLIHKRLTVKHPMDEFSQIIVDEGQDFGEMVYYVLKQALGGCYYTIMGDVSQNINYETGMNDWDALRSFLFDQEGDRFRLLSKSYRNTIEISEFAGTVLEKASAGQYKIQPVIRHGRPVDMIKADQSELIDRMVSVIRGMEERGNVTIAVICRDEEDAACVKAELKPVLSIHEDDTQGFQNGVMILPIALTKGLEFDAVILWKPDEAHYGCNPREAKLLYVAITRALHELVLIGDQEPSMLCR